MPRLVPPTVSVHSSFLAAMAEFQAEGRGGPDDATVIGHDHRTYGHTWHTEAGFAAYVADLLAQPRDTPPGGLGPRDHPLGARLHPAHAAFFARQLATAIPALRSLPHH